MFGSSTCDKILSLGGGGGIIVVNPFSSLTHMCVYEYVKLFYKPWASDIGCNIDELCFVLEGAGLGNAV